MLKGAPDLTFNALLIPVEPEPEEGVGAERDEVWQFADAGEWRLAYQFHWAATIVLRQVEFDRLGKARQIAYHQHVCVLVMPYVG